jgi:hypothetical protein
MSLFAEAFSAGAGFTSKESNAFFVGVLLIMAFIWAGVVVKGYIQRASKEEAPGAYLLTHISVVLVVLMCFGVFSYW